MVLIIIFGSIIIGLSAITMLLVLFVRKVLHNDNARLARAILGLLTLQFVLGMLSNLFVQIPTFEPWRVFHYFGPIVLHTTNALFLLVFSVVFLLNAFKGHQGSRTKVSAVIGCLGVVCAFGSGLIYVNLGQNNIYSFTMSLGFIAAFLAYAFATFSVRHSA